MALWLKVHLQCRTDGFESWSRSPGEGNGNPLWFSCLGNSKGRGDWEATVHGVTKETNMTYPINNSKDVTCISCCCHCLVSSDQRVSCFHNFSAHFLLVHLCMLSCFKEAAVCALCYYLESTLLCNILTGWNVHRNGSDPGDKLSSTKFPRGLSSREFCHCEISLILWTVFCGLPDPTLWESHLKAGWPWSESERNTGQGIVPSTGLASRETGNAGLNPWVLVKFVWAPQSKHSEGSG